MTARRCTYDYLVIATGPKLAFDEIEGFGPQANTRSICHTDDAAAASERWTEFCAKSGTDGGRRSAGRVLLRAGLRICADRGDGPAPAQDPRQGADHLRDL